MLPTLDIFLLFRTVPILSIIFCFFVCFCLLMYRILVVVIVVFIESRFWLSLVVFRWIIVLFFVGLTLLSKWHNFELLSGFFIVFLYLFYFLIRWGYPFVSLLDCFYYLNFFLLFLFSCYLILKLMSSLNWWCYFFCSCHNRLFLLHFLLLYGFYYFIWNCKGFRLICYFCLCGVFVGVVYMYYNL